MKKIKSNKTPKKICANCMHSGHQFKVGEMTHIHCNHPVLEVRSPLTKDDNPWDTLREFWTNCESFELKSKN